jgi:hypothetical protein
MQPTAERAGVFTALDWLGMMHAGFSALGLLLFPVAGRSFGSMFRDLGSGEQLPALTKLAISGWFPILLGLVVLSLVLTGLRRALPLSRRRLALVGAFVLGGAGIGVCLIGIYLPIFAVADAVQAE